MKYAHEVLELMQAFPNRSFRAMEIVRYATKGTHLPQRERESARRAVHRVLTALVQNHTIIVTEAAAASGAFALYALAPRIVHAPATPCHASVT